MSIDPPTLAGLTTTLRSRLLTPEEQQQAFAILDVALEEMRTAAGASSTWHALRSSLDALFVEPTTARPATQPPPRRARTVPMIPVSLTDAPHDGARAR